MLDEWLSVGSLQDFIPAAFKVHRVSDSLLRHRRSMPSCVFELIVCAISALWVGGAAVWLRKSVVEIASLRHLRVEVDLFHHRPAGFTLARKLHRVGFNAKTEIEPQITQISTDCEEEAGTALKP